ncbi:alkaline-phosphatase-like protein [Paraphysoderma sedebokerense]|nr:alkaline-phosphatase-like protein [Paraphysoderma sedebokerense]
MKLHRQDTDAPYTILDISDTLDPPQELRPPSPQKTVAGAAFPTESHIRQQSYNPEIQQYRIRKYIALFIGIIAVVGAVNLVIFLFIQPSGFDIKNPVLLISLDGCRAEYLSRGLTPTLKRLADEGIRSEAMIPSFPTVTFPNHYTIVTGLYPESHGIISNVFYDPILNDTFLYTSPISNGKSQFWGGEPIWVTAIKNGLRASTASWPGSEAEIQGIRPTHWTVYNNSLTVDERIDIALNWLQLPAQEAPQFVSLYIPNIDNAGHKFGSNSIEVNATLQLVDQSLSRMLDILESRKIRKTINIVIVSDHGMTDTSPNKLIYLDDFTDPKKLIIRDAWPILMIDTVNSTGNSYLATVYNDLKVASQGLNFSVYLKEEVPVEHHFSSHYRIPQIIAIPALGYHFTTRTAKTTFAKGQHGYSNKYHDMDAIFVGAGPAFKNIKGMEVKPFENVEVYRILCKLLNIPPAVNNGTGKAVEDWVDRLE